MMSSISVPRASVTMSEPWRTKLSLREISPALSTVSPGMSDTSRSIIMRRSMNCVLQPRKRCMLRCTVERNCCEAMRDCIDAGSTCMLLKLSPEL